MHKLGFLTFSDCRGGRNGIDFPLLVPDTQVCEAVNIDWFAGLLARRRNGAIALTGLAITLSSTVRSLHRYLPTNQENISELFAFDAGTGASRGRFGSWTSVTLPEPDQAKGYIEGVSFNYKLFVAYKNASNSLYVFDPAFSAFRKVGLAKPGPPNVVTSAGAGSLSGTRFYKISFIRTSTDPSSTVLMRSPLSDATSLTITNKANWEVVHSAITGFETGWECWAAATAAGPYYLMQSPIGIGSHYFDSLPPASFPPLGATLAPVEGANTPAPNGKYLMVDEARLLIASSYTDKAYESRVWWTAVLNDASGVNNDERMNLSLSPFIDFDPGEGGAITGVGGPLYDCPHIFKLNRIYKMVRTGNAQGPYRPVTVSKNVGAIHHRTIVLGEDQNGNECLYFLSRRGPYRLGPGGLEYLGRDIEDIWARVNLDAASAIQIHSGTPPGLSVGAHGIYHHDLHQVWWWVPTQSTPDAPDLKLVFDTRLGVAKDVHGVRGGWCQHDGDSAKAVCSVVFTDRTVPSASATLDPLILKPHIGRSVASPVILMCDATAVARDNTVDYTALVRTRAVGLAETVALHGGIIEGHLVLQNRFQASSQGLTATTIRDFGVERRDFVLGTIAGQLLPPTGVTVPTNADFIVPLRDVASVSTAALQVELTDQGLAGKTPINWILDQLVLRVRREEDR